MPLQTFKNSCLNALRLMWPDGIHDRHQQRDAIRTFAMGYMEGLLAAGDQKRANDQLPTYNEIADENWWPNNTWKWW